MTPAPGSGEGLPAPSTAAAPAPANTPAAEAPAAPLRKATPADILPTSPVNAQSATSDAAQTAATAEEAPTEEASSPVVAPAATKIDTGNAIFDQVGTILAGKGIANVDAVLAEAANGDLSLVSQAAIVEALGTDVAQLVVNQLKTEISKTREGAVAETTRLHGYAAQKFNADPAKGEEVWNAIKNFATTPEAGLNAGDQAQLNKMLAAGGSQAEWAINELSTRYAKSKGFNQHPALISGDSATTSGFQPMSRQEYTTEMAKAQQQYGEGSRQVEELRAKRTLSIKRGY